MVLAVPVVVVTIVMPLVLAIVIPVWSTVVISEIASTVLITRGIFAVVPVVFDKENGLATGAVLPAVFVPVLDMTGGDAQINWWAARGDSPNVARAVVDELRRRKTANVESAVEAWLADGHGNSHIGSLRGST